MSAPRVRVLEHLIKQVRMMRTNAPRPEDAIAAAEVEIEMTREVAALKMVNVVAEEEEHATAVNFAVAPKDQEAGK